MRMSTASNVIENGQVYLAEKAPWLAAYVHEIAAFDNGKHDDQVDSTSQALNWFKTRAFVSGVVLYLSRAGRRRQAGGEQASAFYQRVVLPQDHERGLFAVSIFGKLLSVLDRKQPHWISSW